MNKQIMKLLVQFLKDTREDLLKKGYVPTLDLAIEELEEKLAEELDEETNIN